MVRCVVLPSQMARRRVRAVCMATWWQLVCAEMGETNMRRSCSFHPPTCAGAGGGASCADAGARGAAGLVGRAEPSHSLPLSTNHDLMSFFSSSISMYKLRRNIICNANQLSFQQAMVIINDQSCLLAAVAAISKTSKLNGLIPSILPHPRSGTHLVADLEEHDGGAVIRERRR